MMKNNSFSLLGLCVGDIITSPIFALFSFLTVVYLNAYQVVGTNIIVAQKLYFIGFIALMSVFSLGVCYIWFPAYVLMKKQCWFRIITLKSPCVIAFAMWLLPVEGSMIAFFMIPLAFGAFVYGLLVNTIFFLAAVKNK